MSIPKPSKARPPKKKSSKSASVPQQPQKPFKSAELVQDSDDEDEVTEISTVKAFKDSRQKPHRDILRAKSPKNVAKQTSVPAKAAKKRNSKSFTPNVSETESSDAGNNTGEGSPDRKGMQEIALSNPTQKDAVARPGTKVSAAHPRKSDSDGHTSSAMGSESSEREELKTFNQKPAQKSSEPGSRSLGEVPSNPANPARKAVHKKGPETSEEDASGSETEQNSGSEASSESDGEEESRSEESDHSTSQMRSKSRSQATIEPPLLPYAPPSGFEAVAISVRANCNTAELLSPSYLQRKQMWHITAPSSIPISSITEVRKQSVTDGSAVMSYNGAEYGLIGENGDPHESLLLPSAEAKSYKLSNLGVTRMLRLQQIINPGSKCSLPDITNVERPPYSKPIPKQPGGLKMRYKPFGASESEDSQSESLPDGTSQAPKFRVPQELGTGSLVKKRKRHEPDSETARNGDQSSKKARKSALPRTLTANGTLLSELKDTPKKHKSLWKDKDARRHDHHSSTTAHWARSDHDREPILTKASPLEPRTESPKKRKEAIPPVNGERVSTSNDSPKAVSLKRKSKSERNRHDNHSATELTDQSHRKHSSSLIAGTDHDRDATAGAQSSLNEVNIDTVDGKDPSTHKRSKHRDETPEERMKRRAEKRRNKEMKAKKLMEG